MFTDPIKNLRTLGLREDAVVADMGAGTGFYSIPIGKIVTRGKVYAIDIIKDFLATIKNKAKEAHLKNIEILWGDIEKIGGTLMGDEVVDAVIASNVLHQVGDKSKFVEEAKRILKKKGKVLLVDWSTDSFVVGIKSSISKNKALEIFEKKGFILERTIDAGEHHYGMILIKS